MRSFQILRLVVGNVVAVYLAGGLAGQTALDLRTQTRNVDFSGAVSTKPSRVGASLPATCSTGEVFFHTAAVPGQNWYGCTATNVWTLQSGSGGSGGGSVSGTGDLSDCKVTASGNVATVAGPCKVALGTVTHTVTASATASLSGTSASGTVYFYWNLMGQLTADEDTAATLSCVNCVPASTGGFPPRVVRVASVAFTNNTFGAVSDERVFLGHAIIDCGVGLTCSESGSTGALTITPDTVNTFQTKAAAQAGGVHYCAPAGGSGTDYACNLTPALWGYVAGMQVILRPDVHSTGAVTLNINGLGARPVQKAAAGVLADLAPGDLNASIPYLLLYTGSAFVVQPYGAAGGVAGRLALLGQTTDLGAQILLPAGHAAGTYRVSVVFTVTAAGSSTASVVAGWRSPASASNLAKTILSAPAGSEDEFQASYVLRSTGASAITLDPGFSGVVPTYHLHATVERLQ